MKKIKRFLVLIFCLFLFYVVYLKRDYIVFFVMKNIIDKNEIYLGDRNSYYKDVDYGFVQNSSNLNPKNSQDILNIIYSTLNRGVDGVTFYCPLEYESCINDVNEIADNNIFLSTINNLVHPFNSYNNIYFTITSYRKVHIDVSRIYPDSFISMIENKVNDISNSIINSDMSIYDKIQAYHDYLVNNTYYDSSISESQELLPGNNSNNAYGVLFDNKAICSGYSDAMAIFLTKLGLNNYKISSEKHIWNLVYFDGSWKHIDVTWDDPVTNDGSNVLLHDFFLIDTNQLLEKESSLGKNEHSFDKTLYLEAF